MRNLYIVLGDQLDRQAKPIQEADPQSDTIWMTECHGEAGYVWSNKVRIAMFFAAMRHYAQDCESRGQKVLYREISQHAHQSLTDALAEDLRKHKPQRVCITQPGSYRVLDNIRRCCAEHDLELEVSEDEHFYTTPSEFAKWADGRKELRLEYFYRELRKRFDVLMSDGRPAGGKWNYDKSNRSAFGKQGPGILQGPISFTPDATTQSAIDDVETFFADHPGKLDKFDWPTTPAQAQQALEDFIENRLIAFGEYQDAMWTDEAWLYHSRLSAALNLKLIAANTVVNAAVHEYTAGRAPIEAVEGFVRQILGWREFVRGVYWMKMPEYINSNALSAQQPLPAFFWDGNTDLECQRQAIRQTLDYGYAHHIQRLMVTGLFCLLLGVRPEEVHQWYLAVYIDAVEWVEVPNTLGMSQYADGGIIGSKPYIASGKYIQRMSNYCDNCRYNPNVRSGDDACPITTLYWDFLQKHQNRLSKNSRLALQLRNLETLSQKELADIQREAANLREVWATKPGIPAKAKLLS